MIPAGIYPCKVIDHAITKSSQGHPMVAVALEVKSPEGPTIMNWFGSFNGGAREITVETLVKCGFKGSDPSELARIDPGSPMCLDGTLELECTIKHEPNPKRNNAIQARVAFINLPGASGFKKLARPEVVSLFGGLNIGADFVKARQKQPVPTSSPAVAAMRQPGDDEDTPLW